MEDDVFGTGASQGYNIGPPYLRLTDGCETQEMAQPSKSCRVRGDKRAAPVVQTPCAPKGPKS